MKKYQEDFATKWPSMYNKTTRTKKSQQIVKVLKHYHRPKSLKTLSVLDVGASSGIIDSALAKYFKKVTGIDIDEKAIKFAQKNFKIKNLSFKVGDAMNIPFKENHFDVVLCTQVYEHVPDAKKLFSEIYRVLKPGGVCYLAALNKLWPWEPHYDLPFLAWLPKPIANAYVKILGKSEEYYETLLTPWALKRICSRFEIADYTSKILKDPKTFGYNDKLLKVIKPVVNIFSPILPYLTPTMFWILVKPSKAS